MIDCDAVVANQQNVDTGFFVLTAVFALFFALTESLPPLLRFSRRYMDLKFVVLCEYQNFDLQAKPVKVYKSFKFYGVTFKYGRDRRYRVGIQLNWFYRGSAKEDLS